MATPVPDSTPDALRRLSERLNEVLAELEAQRVLHRATFDGRVTLASRPPHVVLQVNPPAARLLGLSETDLLDTPFLDLIVPSDWETAEALLERARRGAGAAGLVQLRPRRAPPVAAFVAVVGHDPGGSLTCSVRDLRSLGGEQADAWMRRAVEEMPLGVLILDRNERLKDWNAAAESMLEGEFQTGRDLASALGRAWPHLSSALEAARGGEVRTLGAGDAEELESAHRVTVFPVFDAEGRPDRIGLLVEDRLLEAELLAERSELERWLRGIFDAIGDAVVVTDRHGHVVAWNPGAERLYGWSVEEATGRSFAALVEEETEVAVGARTTGNMVDAHGWVGRVIHRDRDGSSLELDVVMRGLLDPTGAFEGRVAVYRPSSVAGQLDARMLRAERLQALESLAGGMAHEFNNLLGVILSNTAYLGARLGDDVDLRDAIEQMQDAARRGANLTQRISTFARGASPTKERHADLVEAVEAVAGLLVAERQRGLRLELDLPEGPCIVDAEASQLQQAVLNLVLNARDAVGGSGTVRVSVRPNPSVGVVELFVDDDGEGVPTSLRKQIFDPFFTTKPPGGGAGLGLAVVHSLVVGQWDGEIDVTDVPGGGARFVVTLPISASTEPAVDERRRMATPELRSVLVVDDEPAVRAATARLFKLLGAVPTTAGSAAEAGERIRAGAVPDLVVLDVVMPQMSGDELYRDLRPQHPMLPVLFVSGYPAGRLEAIVEDDPNAGFLQKPFDLLGLASEVKRLLRASG
ncbi:MAG: ATP-binding protein [Sandaracinaceae bacterium]